MTGIASISRPRRTPRPVVVFAVLLVAYLVWLVVAHRSELDRAVLRFQGAQTRWFVLAISFEIVSQGLSVVVQHRLLHRAGSPMGWWATARLVLAQNAIGLALPGGPAVAAGFSYSQIRRRGADASIATWVVAASSTVGLLALTTFSAFTTTGTSWLSLLGGVALVAVLWVLVTLVRSPERLRRPFTHLVRLTDRVRRRAGEGTIDERVTRRLATLAQVELRWHDGVFLAGFALAAVAADCAVWICASHAIIVLPARCLTATVTGRAARNCALFRAPSSAGLLLAYAAGQGALAVPFLPGGIGLVESVMTTALTAAKVRAIPALSAVLLYRVISFWSVLIVGGIVWLTLRRERRIP